MLGTRSWSDGPLLGFDTETTGVDVHEDRIVTAALVRREPSGETQVQTWLLNPGIPIPEGASAIHGVTTEHASRFGAPPAEALTEMAEAITRASREGIPLVAFNATFDVSILDAELRRHDLPTIPERLGGELVVLDPLVLDRAEDRFRKGKRKLGDLCSVYGVTSFGDLHTADVDVLATLDVLHGIMDRFEHLSSMPLTELHEYQRRAHHEWATNFNEWRTRQGFTGPGAGVTWLKDERAGAPETPALSTRGDASR